MSLMVIFGAGASYDAVPPDCYAEGMSEGPLACFQPPIVRDLFANRPNFGEAMDEIPEVRALVMEFRGLLARGHEVNLERELQGMQNEADTGGGGGYSEYHAQLAAFRFYLQRILWECGETWGNAAHWGTTYLELLQHLRKWHFQTGEQVALVTFNYDFMLDYALRDVLRIPAHWPKSVDDYIARDDFKLLKLHGSVNWTHPIWRSANARPRNLTRSQLIDKAADVEIRQGEFTIIPSVTGHPHGFPALAIPVEEGKNFECPATHVQTLEKLMKATDKLLIVGWRARERHFLKLWETAHKPERVHIANNEADEGHMAARELEAVGFTPGAYAHPGGFVSYVRSGQLDELLAP